MTTLAELVAAAPDPTFGIPQPTIVEGAGAWRFVVELADPGADVDVEWHDVTDDHLGYFATIGGDEPFGRYRAGVIETGLLAFGDEYSPRNPDTSDRFGVHVPIGDGLLMRAGFIRVLGGETVEWIPRWTGEVESWSHAYYGFVTKAGKTQRVRRHDITLTDLLSTLASQPVGAASVPENWPDRVDHVLLGWEFGATVYGAETWDDSGTPTDVLEIPARDEQDDALAELAATCDPTGLIYHTNRKGQLVVRPHPIESFHADYFALSGTTGTEYTDPATIVFRYDAATAGDGVAYADGLELGDSFGIESDRRGVINHIRISDPSSPPVYDSDRPTSIQRHRRRTSSRNWIATNDTAAEDILDRQEEAHYVARPLRTTIHTPRFWPSMVRMGYLDPVEIIHDDDQDGELVTVAEGHARQFVERAGPSPALDMAIAVVVDLASQSTTAALKPVTGLTATSITETSADIEWTHPGGQPATPTHFQIRNRTEGDIPLEYPYGPTLFAWLGMEPDTAQTVEVRLLRKVGSKVTHVSPWASHTFTTLEIETPASTGGTGTTTTIDAPDPDPGCVLEWELQSSVDSVTWFDVDDGTWTAEPYEIDSSLLTPEILYRVRTREVCSGTPGDWSDWSDPFFIPADYASSCLTPAALAEAPYDDPSLVLYVPQFCAPDIIRDAVSGREASKGPSYAFLGFSDGNPVIRAGSVSGVVAYGQSLALRMSGNQARTISARILHENNVEYLVAQAAALRIDVVSSGSDYVFEATAELVTGDLLVATSTTALTTGTEYTVTATYDPYEGTLKLYTGTITGATEIATVTNAAAPMPLVDNRAYWYLGASSNGGWATDLAVWTELVVTAAAPASFFGLIAMAREFWAEDPDWLTKPADGGNMGSWRDNGTIGTAATAATGGGSLPTYHDALVNGKPAVDFSATNNTAGGYMFVATTSINTPVTVFVVGRVDVINSAINAPYMIDTDQSSSAPYAAIGALNSGSQWTTYHNAALNLNAGSWDSDLHLFVLVIKTNDYRFYIDGTLIGTDASGTAAASILGMTLGADRTAGGSKLNGAIAYAGQYEGDLTAHADYSDWSTQIMDHYGIT